MVRKWQVFCVLNMLLGVNSSALPGFDSHVNFVYITLKAFPTEQIDT